MTNKKDSALPTITGAGLADGDLFRLVDISDTTDGPSGSSKKITKAELSSVMGSAGSPIVRRFSFAYNTANILTGHVIYTPTIDDILLDAWFEVTTAWDGTTPYGDFGWFDDPGAGHVGIFQYSGGAYALNRMSQAAVPQGGPNRIAQGQMPLSASNAIGGTFDSSAVPAIASTPSAEQPFVRYNLEFTVSPSLPIHFLTADPIQVVVSQNGKNNGADPGSTQGAAYLYLVTVTPV